MQGRRKKGGQTEKEIAAWVESLLGQLFEDPEVQEMFQGKKAKKE